MGEDVVGGVLGGAVYPGVGVAAAVEQTSGQEAVQSVLVECSELAQQGDLRDIALRGGPEAAQQPPHHLLLHGAETSILEAGEDLRHKILISSE